MSDARKDLLDQILFLLMGKGESVEDYKNELYIILDKYEIQNRTTEIALLSEDKNEYLIKKFLIAKTVKGCTERTLYHYETYLKGILTKIGKTVDEIEADDIRIYLAIRQKRDRITKTSANNELLVLRTFFQYLTSEELVQKNPTIKVDRVKSEKKKKKAFSEMEIEQIRNSLKNNRERAIVEVLLSTGCRISELVGIKISDIENDKLVVHGKGEKDRTVYLNAKAQIAISNYLEERNDGNPFLFCGGYYSAEKLHEYGSSRGEWYKNENLVSKTEHADKGSIEQIMRRLRGRSGIKTSIYPHKFRRTCATFALKRGMPIEQVSKMLGHENISTTQIYLDLNEEELQNAHKKYVV